MSTNGSKQVCPDSTTLYRLGVTGDGAPGSASTTVTVTHVVDKLALHVNFDFNKATIRKGEDAELQKAVAFIKKYPGSEISLVGYTDSIGSDAYNLKLSEKRAQAVKDYLASHGIDGSKIRLPAAARPIRSATTRPRRAAPRTGGSKSRFCPSRDTPTSARTDPAAQRRRVVFFSARPARMRRA